MFESSFIVNATLWVLISFSVVSWAIIAFKLYESFVRKGQNHRYAEEFWDSPSLPAAAELSNLPGPMSRIAKSGFDVLKSGFMGDGGSLESMGNPQDILERNLRQSIEMERQTAERGLVILASVGSTSPFVGLFGTVWGIMHALKDISKSGSASLDVVAGPIGEALIATAIGIAAAIPAVMAYNYFLRQNKLFSMDLENFATDFLHLALRTGFALKRG
jgi:biopolymer transport protein ExbB